MSTLRSWARRASIAATFTALLSVAQDARAQDAQAIAQARFETGRARFEARQFDQAIEEFSQSLRAYASPNTRLYYAQLARSGTDGRSAARAASHRARGDGPRPRDAALSAHRRDGAR